MCVYITISTVYHLLCCSCREPDSGLIMEVYTNQPGVQFYTGNFLDDSALLRSNQPCYKHAGFCLETQAYPNAINQVQQSLNATL